MWVFRIGVAIVMLLALVAPSHASSQAQEELTVLNKQAQDFYEAGNYVGALARQQALVDLIEKMETGSALAPGPATASALAGLAWFAICARKFDAALEAAERAHALAPRMIFIEANHAHALLLMNRLEEARALYLAYKGVRVAENGDKLWEDLIIDDFETLQRIGVSSRAFDEIIADLAPGLQH